MGLEMQLSFVLVPATDNACYYLQEPVSRKLIWECNVLKRTKKDRLAFELNGGMEQSGSLGV